MEAHLLPGNVRLGGDQAPPPVKDRSCHLLYIIICICMYMYVVSVQPRPKAGSVDYQSYNQQDKTAQVSEHLAGVELSS